MRTRAKQKPKSISNTVFQSQTSESCNIDARTVFIPIFGGDRTVLRACARASTRLWRPRCRSSRTCRGALASEACTRLLARLNEDPERLRDQVTSPNGTTLAALEELEKAGFRDTISKAILAAKKRSEELSQER